MDFINYKRIDIYNKSEMDLPAAVNKLLNEKIARCGMDRQENPIVRIAPNTYVNVYPNLQTHKMIGWTLGDRSKGANKSLELPSFFEIKQAINHKRPSVIASLTGENPVWTATCMGKSSNLPNSKIKKILVVKSINQFPIERIMPYWSPIIQKLGKDTRGDNWRIPLMYMTRPGSELKEGPLGVHIPLSNKNLQNGVVKSLFSNPRSTIKCVFDMENLKVVTIDGCEYLVALGTIANNRSSLYSVSMVVGVYNLSYDEKENPDEDAEL